LALCTVLLAGAALMGRSFAALHAVERGFEPDGVLTARLSLPGARFDYADPPPISDFYEEVIRVVEDLPGVIMASVTEQLPLSGGTSSREAYSYRTPEGEVEWGSVAADTRSVSSEYFETVGATLVAGRTFTTEDQLTGRNVVVVDDRLAERAWPGQDPIGQQVKASVFISGETVPIWSEVVGVVRHVRLVPLSTEGAEQIYLHHVQSPRRSMSLAVRTSADPVSLAPAVRAAVLALDPEQPIFDVRPLEAYVGDSVGTVRFILALLGTFAGLAVLLAVLGVHGLLSYVVSGARREIGIRVALGAGPSDIVPEFLKRGVVLVAIGVGIGLVAAVIASAGLRGVVFGVAVRDPAALGASALLLIATGLAACYLPVRRALRVDPAEILADEQG
jgi:predicted permease